MATRWTMPIAATHVEKFLNGDRSPDVIAAVKDIGRRFPFALAALVDARTSPGAMLIIKHLPRYFTVRKCNAALEAGDADATPADETEVELEDPEEGDDTAAAVATLEKSGSKKNTKTSDPGATNVDMTEIDQLLGVS